MDSYARLLAAVAAYASEFADDLIILGSAIDQGKNLEAAEDAIVRCTERVFRMQRLLTPPPK